MPGNTNGSEERQLTARGIATRQRIIETAARLMYVQGVCPTTLDDVIKASGVSKSQLYNNFPDKADLVREVIAHHCRNVLAIEAERLQRVNSLLGLKRWRDATVQANALQKGAHGCPLGSMTAELADHDDTSRQALLASFVAHRQLFADALQRLQDNGTLRQDADPTALAAGLLAALHGGYMLARAAHDPQPLADAVDAALDHVHAYRH